MTASYICQAGDVKTFFLEEKFIKIHTKEYLMKEYVSRVPVHLVVHTDLP